MAEEDAGYYERKFYENMLAQYGATKEDIAEKWKFAGGDRPPYMTYFRTVAPWKASFPAHATSCICTHPIKENCYITDDFRDTSRYVVVGNCCVKRFLSKDKQGKTCALCGSAHRNRTTNLCNSCRVGHCLVCHKDIDERYTRCYRCEKHRNVYI